MRIVVDLQGAQTENRFRGIGRYSISLTKAILRNRGNHEIVIVLNGLLYDSIDIIRDEFYGLIAQENIHVWFSPGPQCESNPENNWRREAGERIREVFLLSLNPDVILVLSFFEGFSDDAVVSIKNHIKNIPVATIFYDIIPYIYRSEYLDENIRYKDFYLRKIEDLKKTDLVFAISESSANEAKKYLDTNDLPIFNISSACDDIFIKKELEEDVQKKLLEKFSIDRPFLVYTGGADRRKNLDRLISAYSKVDKSLLETHQLVIIGKIAEPSLEKLKDISKKMGLSSKDVIFTGYVSDNDLVSLYNLCKLFVFPSRHEGFGLPVLEAISCGAPVIASNSTSLPEILNFKEALFDPYSETGITSKIEQVLFDGKLRQTLIENGLKRSNYFSWDISALKVFGLLENYIYPGEAQNDINTIIDDLIHSIHTIKPFTSNHQNLLITAQAIADSFSNKEKKQLFVDVSELVQRDAKSGIQRVVRSILSELLKEMPEGIQVEPVYASLDQFGYKYASKFISGFNDTSCESRVNDEVVEINNGDIFLVLDLQGHIVDKQQTYYNHLRNVGVKVFFIVYDLLPIQFPQCFVEGAKDLHEKWLRTVCNSDGAICISKSVASELKLWVSKNISTRRRPFNIGWFHLGADIENSKPTKGLPEDSVSLLKMLGMAPTFLMVGTIEPRKGHAQTIAAFTKLWEEKSKCNLIIIGKEGWMVSDTVKQITQHKEYGKKLFWLKSVSDEYLDKIYTASTCLLAASVGEGFGLPLIEAARYQLYIIARDIPVFREVAGENAYYFDGDSSEALMQSIENWLKLYEINSVPDSGGISWLTWQQSTLQLCRVIQGYCR